MTVPAPKPLRDEVMTIPEIAWLTKTKRSTVERWRIRNVDTPKAFLEPDDYAGSNPVFRVTRVMAWLDEHRPGLERHTIEEWRKNKAAGGFRRKPELV